MVPRGGRCKSCKQYTVWGDIIRGCYRRMPPSEVANPLLDIDTDDMFVSDNLEVRGKTMPSGRTKKSASPTKHRKSSKEKGKQRLWSGSTSKSHESEIFDLSNLVTSSESEDISGPVKRKPGRPRKILTELSPPSVRQLSPKDGGKQRRPVANSVSRTRTGGEILDFSNHVASSELNNATPIKRKRGRPCRDMATPSPGASSSGLSPARKTKESLSPTKHKLSSKGKGNQSFSSPSTSESETFDFNNLVASLRGEATSTPVKRKRGRPSKDATLLLPGLTSPIVSTRPHMLPDISTKKPKGVTPTNCQELLKGKGKQKQASSPISLISSSEEEIFDIHNVIASPEPDDTATSIKRQRGRPRRIPVVISPPIEPGQSSKGKEQNSNIVRISVDISDSIKKNGTAAAATKPRRSPKNTVLLSSGIPPPISYTQPHKPLGGKDVPTLTRTYHGRCKAESDGSSSGESFDFSGIHDNDDSDENLTANRNPDPSHRDLRTAKIVWPLHRKVNPLKLGGTQNRRAMHGLEQAMSVISFTPRQKTAFRTDQSNSHEVIEVSD